jgi:hypothetical protein
MQWESVTALSTRLIETLLSQIDAPKEKLERSGFFGCDR